jgi:tetratricopeptide (TPR) repeat protein
MSKTSSALVFSLVLIAATLAVYLPGLGNSLVFDDNRLTDGTIFRAYGSLLELRPRMLSYGSFVWIKALFGDDWWKQRLFNVLLHLGVAFSLYQLLAALLRRTRFSEEDGSETKLDAALPPSTVAALRVGIAVFALNPVAVYAVAYLVQRSILMATLFVVLACWAFVQGLVTRRPGWLVAAFLAYVLAVMSKEHAFLAAGLALPLYIFVVRPDWKRTLRLVAVALVLVLVAAAILYQRFGAILGVAFDENSRLLAQQLDALQPGVSKLVYPLSIVNQAALFFYYGFLWFFPNVMWMSVDLRPAFPLSVFTFPQILGAIGFVGVLLGSAWLVLRRSDALGFAALCVLFPSMLYFTEFVTVWLQDPFVLYRSYLWALAVPGLVALLLIGWSPRVIYPIGLVVAVLFAGLAFERTQTFRNELTLWSDAVDKINLQASPNAVGRWRPFVNRGAYYLEREMPDYALNDFARAEALGEIYGSARFNMGVSQQLMKKHEDALASFAKAETLGFTEPVLYYHRGESESALGRYRPALESYSAFLAKARESQIEDVVRLRRAETAIAVDQFDVAIQDFKTLLQKKPNEMRLQMGLGLAYAGKRDTAAALAVFNPMLAAGPTASAYYGRAMTYVLSGDKAAGLKDLDQAIALEPTNGVYKNLRAQIAAQK